MHYYMFNKPYGCVTARRDARYPTVMDYFDSRILENLSPVGRLDRETEGLLLITDDGKWNQEMTHPDHHVEKTYEFIAMGTWSPEKTAALQNGVLLTGADHYTAPAKITIQRETFLPEVMEYLAPEMQKKRAHNRPDQPVVCGRITVTEGKKHQIRRMMRCVGCYVIFLKRISIGSITLDPALKPGEWKEL